MYVITFVRRINTKDLSAKADTVQVKYDLDSIAKRAEDWGSLGYQGIKSIEINPKMKLKKGNPSIPEVWEMFYPKNGKTMMEKMENVASAEDAVESLEMANEELEAKDKVISSKEDEITKLKKELAALKPKDNDVKK